PRPERARRRPVPEGLAPHPRRGLDSGLCVRREDREGQRGGVAMYHSPDDARQQPPEDYVYVACLYEGTGIEEPDFIAVVDVNPDSDTYSQIVHRTPMPNVGDELHHFGWNVCSSACHSELTRDTLIVPGIQSSRIHILDVSDPRKPEVAKVIEG